MAKKEIDVPHIVTLVYTKGEDYLNFKSKANADAAVERLREDAASPPGTIITVEDDNGKTINFRNRNFDRTITVSAGNVI